jgi:hypothetical protein
VEEKNMEEAGEPSIVVRLVSGARAGQDLVIRESVGQKLVKEGKAKLAETAADRDKRLKIERQERDAEIAEGEKAAQVSDNKAMTSAPKNKNYTSDVEEAVEV